MIKKRLLVTMLLLFAIETFAHDSGVTNKVIAKNGIGLGAMIAIVISWDRNKSILYAIIHGILGWLYVIYYFLTKEK
ncbi:hypothetical protein [Tenacibaculum pelagium]|uniref:hypothetical protein n=1 Tax=Tenacibaculum pelagium TaxID=2759527 RepID=UPI001FE501CC|nr:hypothetical protein [Tenacibaculum pelagium]